MEREVNLVEGKLKNLGFLVEDSVKADHVKKLEKERIKEAIRAR